MAAVRESATANRTLGTGPGPASALVFSRSRLVRTGKEHARQSRPLAGDG